MMEKIFVVVVCCDASFLRGYRFIERSYSNLTLTLTLTAADCWAGEIVLCMMVDDFLCLLENGKNKRSDRKKSIEFSIMNHSLLRLCLMMKRTLWFLFSLLIFMFRPVRYRLTRWFWLSLVTHHLLPHPRVMRRKKMN